MLFVILGDRIPALLPVIVVFSVRKQIEHPLFVIRQHPQRRGAFLERSAQNPLTHIGKRLVNCGFEIDIGQRFLAGGRHAEGIDHEPLFERAVLPHRTVVVIRRANSDDHRRQVRRIERCQRRLVTAAIRPTHRANLPIAPLLRGEPFHRVVAIGSFLGKRIPLALAGKAAAHILNRADVTAPGVVRTVRHIARCRLIVGSAFQNYRKFSRRRLTAQRGKIDVSGQADAIPHRNHHVGLAERVVLLMGTSI